MKIRLKVIGVICMLLAGPYVSGQKSVVYFDHDKDLYTGIELYEKQKFGAARSEFEKIIEATEGMETQVRAEAMYYNAMSAIHLYNLDAEYQVYKFIAEHPESPRIHSISFELANYYHYKLNWARAIMWYNKIDRQELSESELGEYYFKKGYAYYMRNDYDNARVTFYEIVDKETSYSPAAIYYYSHIHYTQGNYETALNGFKQIEKDPMFNKIAPYYISQILYLQKKYQEVTDYAPSLMDSISEKRIGEMAKIIGESYYMVDKYKEAIPFLETYKGNTKRYSAKDRYQMAFSYYKAGQFDEASEIFEKITYRENELAQSALYHLADCYLNMGQKNKAMTAFAEASKMDYDQMIQEDALFNYAKLAYELDYNPFNEAIKAFNLYISYYPSSERIDQAYNYLVLAYLQTKNFSMALSSLEKIRYKNVEIEKAYQKVAFYRGLELYQNLRFTEAVEILERSLEYGKYDDAILARTYYWLGEAAYRSEDLTMARSYFQEFLDQSLAHLQQEFALSHYSMGYLYFDGADYPEAERWFGRYINLEDNEESKTLSDAYNRLGDCKFVQKDYWRSIEQYNESIRLGKSDRDYAYFQKGFTYGILNRPEQKREVMESIIADMPESSYIDDALFELGRTLVSLGSTNESLEVYQQLVEEHPNSSYLSKALNQLGLIYFNNGKLDQSLDYYSKVAQNYPGSEEADVAIQSLESIYVKNDNIDGYLAFINNLGRDISNKEQDSLMYVAAENIYTSGDCAKAIVSLENYISNHPNGNYLLNAHYYTADCHLKLNQPVKALVSLDYIAALPRNMFSELALVASSRIHFDNADYNIAVEHYLQLLEIANEPSNVLEASIGVMRCYYNLDEYDNTIEAAVDLINLEKVPEEIQRETWYKIATSYMALNEPDEAIDYYRKNADHVNTVEGAESKFMIAKIMYDSKALTTDYTDEDFRAVESEIFDFIEKNTPHQFWMGKAFLLLSDVYLMLNDEFQAIHTLKSIIDYYTVPDDGIVEEAVRRHERLTAEVETEMEESPVEESEINE
ncbi:tetratricopeptide repeat protein [Bacteroidota bacterium]